MTAQPVAAAALAQQYKRRLPSHLHRRPTEPTPQSHSAPRGWRQSLRIDETCIRRRRSRPLRALHTRKKKTSAGSPCQVQPSSADSRPSRRYGNSFRPKLCDYESAERLPATQNRRAPGRFQRSQHSVGWRPMEQATQQERASANQMLESTDQNLKKPRTAVQCDRAGHSSTSPPVHGAIESRSGCRRHGTSQNPRLEGAGAFRRPREAARVDFGPTYEPPD